MNKLEETAINSFRSGLNCAQSVIIAFSDQLKFDSKIALEITSGFGAGMGRLQETCGAVTASFMVIGILNSQKFSDINESKENTISGIQDFAEKFKAINKVMDCRSLINCDLNTDEGQLFYTENNLGKFCEKCISDSVKILEETL